MGNLQKFRQRHKLAGLCIDCSMQAVTNETRCEGCKAKHKQVKNRMYDERLENGLCRCGKLTTIGFRTCVDCRLYNQKKHAEDKRLCFDRYGRVCTCCQQAFTEPFLTLNHVNNDGAAHRREMRGSMYQWARRHDFPSVLETHCWNCNGAKMVNGGICPHQSII